MNLKEVNKQGYVQHSINENGIATVEFYHPLSNSLPGNLLKELAEIITILGKKEEVKVLILTSSGDRAFCAGANFDELISIQDLSTGKRFFSGFANVINACRKCPKFIIGCVHGKAVGGGVGLAATVDYCLATPFAAVKLSELAVGIGPFVVGPAVTRKIGVSAMSELAINATEWKSADWALQKGLYTELYNNKTAVLSAANELAEKLAASNPQAMQLLKATFWEGTEDWDELLLTRAAMSGELVLSEFTVNAIKKFKSK